MKAKVGRRGHVPPGGPHGERIGVKVHRHFEVFADAPLVVVHVGIEQRFGNDPRREPHHFAVNVAGLVGLPGRQQFLRVVDHGGGVLLNLPGLEGGLRHGPLASPGFAVARQQSVPQEGPQRDNVKIFFERAVLVPQDFLDLVRVVEHIERQTEAL